MYDDQEILINEISDKIYNYDPFTDYDLDMLARQVVKLNNYNLEKVFSLANFLSRDAHTRFIEVSNLAETFPDDDKMKHVLDFHYNFYIIQREIRQVINKISISRESCKEETSLSSMYQLFGSFSFDITLKQSNDDRPLNEEAVFSHIK